MAKVTYLNGQTEQFGYEFGRGEAVEVDDAKLIEKFRANRFFQVEEDLTGAGEQSSTGLDENGDTAEMAAMRGQFNTAWERLKGDLETANGTIATLTDQLAEANAKLAALASPPELKAEHHGGGKFNITRGETVLAKGLSKADADAFNAMTDEEKAAYVAKPAE